MRGRGQDAAGCIRQLAVGPLTNRVGPFTAQQRGNLKWSSSVSSSVGAAATASVASGSVAPSLSRDVVLLFTHELVLDRPNVGVVELNLSSRSRALRKNLDTADELHEDVVVDVPEYEEHVDMDSFSESSGSDSTSEEDEDEQQAPPRAVTPPKAPQSPSYVNQSKSCMHARSLHCLRLLLLLLCGKYVALISSPACVAVYAARLAFLRRPLACPGAPQSMEILILIQMKMSRHRHCHPLANICTAVCTCVMSVPRSSSKNQRLGHRCRRWTTARL